MYMCVRVCVQTFSQKALPGNLSFYVCYCSPTELLAAHHMLAPPNLLQGAARMHAGSPIIPI